jgi:hypothetical protein
MCYTTDRDLACFGWKDSPYESTPKHIYLMNKTCLSCSFYHDCCIESEERLVREKQKNG